MRRIESRDSPGMVYLWAALVTLLNLLWLIAAVLGLPGTWLIAGTSAAFTWWLATGSGAERPLFMSALVLVTLLVLAVAGEILEFWAAAAGARSGGASRRGAIGALLGSIVGAIAGTIWIPIPVAGSLIGACLGAAFGATTFEVHAGRDIDPSIRAGLGAGIGRLGGSVAKLAICAVMWIIATVAAFWP